MRPSRSTSRQPSLSQKVSLSLRQLLFSRLACLYTHPDYLLIASRNGTFAYLFLVVFEWVGSLSYRFIIVHADFL
jgi:hypothetical protein